MSTRSSRHQTNECENPKINENINSLWPRMCRDFATLEQHLLSRVKEDALERHDETLENESRVVAAKRNSHVEPDTMPKEFSAAP